MTPEHLNPWSPLLESIRRRRSSDARFFKPVCLVAVIDGVLEGEVVPGRIDPVLAIERFRKNVAPVFPLRADLGWRPFWHLSNDGAWQFTCQGRRVEPADFGSARKPDSRGQLLSRIDHVAVVEESLYLWQKREELDRLREALLEMLEEDDEDCKVMAAVLRNNLRLGVDKVLDPQVMESEHADGPKNRGQGFQVSLETRIAVEQHAMVFAAKILRDEGWNVQDVSTVQCFDFLCSRESETVYVEVKGTTGEGDQIILTRAEVEYARENRASMMLIVVSGIRIDRNVVGDIVTCGGTAAIYRSWSPLDTELRPISYVYRLASTDRNDTVSRDCTTLK